MKKRKLTSFAKKEENLVSFACQGAFSDGTFSVDADTGLFKNISIITKGPILGHNMVADDTTLKQVMDSINKKAIGIKSRITHPEGGGFFGPSTDAIEVMVGRAKNAKLDKNKIKGDLQLGQYAKKSPKGDLWGYLTSLAAEDPEAAGISITFFAGDHEERKDKDGLLLAPACRIEEVVGVDFVGNPAANPDGFFASKDSHRKETYMNKKLRKFLIQLGLAADATDAQAIAYWQALEGKHKWIADALAEGDAEDEKSEGEGEETSPEDEKSEGEEAPSEDEKSEGEAEETPSETQASKKKAILLADKQRRTAIMALAKTKGLPTDWSQGLCDRGVSLAQATELAELATRMQPILVGSGGISSGDDQNKASLSDAICDAILLRAGSPLIEMDEQTGIAIRDESGKIKTRKPHERAHKFKTLSLLDMGRRYLNQLGVPGVDYMSKVEVTSLLFSPQKLRDRYGVVAFAQSTSDFPYILENVLRKSLRAAYAEIPTDWPKFCSRMTVADYKQISLTSLSEAPDLVQRYEGEEIDYGTLSENRETATLVDYDKGLKFTRRSMINDDLNAFSRIPKILGQAAARKEDDVAFAILTANAALVQDSIALFDAATHDNYITAGGAPSISTLNVGAAKLGTQKGIGGASYLNIVPKSILIPVALMGTTKQLIASTVDPAATYGHAANIWANRLEIVANPRLDASNAAGWYLAADPGLVDTIAVIFLQEEQTPVVKQEVEFDTDDLKFAVRHSVVAKAIDYRGLFYNDGVT